MGGHDVDDAGEPTPLLELAQAPIHVLALAELGSSMAQQMSATLAGHAELLEQTVPPTFRDLDDAHTHIDAALRAHLTHLGAESVWRRHVEDYTGSTATERRISLHGKLALLVLLEHLSRIT
ncbi:hypothetical protein [Gordonia sp. OPL2]|uniref:hypothetical protein n=1 Tax=Gordonia sp. OPL2 TaxID=2486274 RepID=UPI001655DD08|nr:hypothetical protein [Gordonia sp. OPL2]ROZ88082.1 hypothetical protein EEB19_22360 [Gordonia sp. OPL2]